MSRGLGLVQREILLSLNVARPEAWVPLSSLISWSYPTDHLPLRRGRPERATWRRAMRSLASRGLVESRVLYVDTYERTSGRDWYSVYRPDHRRLEVRLTAAGSDYIEQHPAQFDHDEIIREWEDRIGIVPEALPRLRGR